MGLPGGTVVKNPSANARDVDGFNPWVRKIPQSRKWQPDPVFLAWKIPWTRAWRATAMGSKESEMTERLSTTHGHITS